MIGIILMGASLFLWLTGAIHLIWEGSVGLILGSIFLMAPTTIETLVSQFIKSWGRRDNDDNYFGGGDSEDGPVGYR